MNGAKVYADDFSISFAQEGEFLDFLKKREQETVWRRETANELRFEALKADTERTDSLIDVYRENDKEEVITDTLANTQLVLRADDSMIPVRSCAIKSILERARISGNALSKVERPVFAKILNHCLKVADGQALLKVSDDKLSAVHSGDKGDYAILEMYELFSKTADYLNDNFNDVKYIGGFFEHSAVTAIWSLEGNDELIQVYKELLEMHDAKPIDLKPSLRLTSSDVGLSGANLYPTLLADGKNIPLGSPLKLEHKHGASISDFEEKLDMVYSQYDLAMGKLSNLLSITINHPQNTMMGVMKKIGIPKKYAMEVIDRFITMNSNNPCSAHDIYYGIADVIFTLQCSGERGVKITQMEEMVARALNVRWVDFDFPGNLSW